MAEASKIVNIRVNNLYPHPDNPRKNIGDVTELAESIKKSGIMQNLTVIPISALDEDPEEQPVAEEMSLLSDFIVLIGHRRMTAAKQAGLSEVPCKIVSKISKKEQVSIMLEENMQRNDLTIYEQAQGFQMMLDLGETEDSIAEKTGFSKTTIRHRLNIAKLNQTELQKKEKDDNFQLSLKDLYALEQVEDIKTRNKILKEATSSRDIVWKAQNAAAEARRDKVATKIIKLLKEKGLGPAPECASRELYSSKWDIVRRYSLEEKAPEKVRFKEEDTANLLYLKQYREVIVIKKAQKKKETSWEKAERERKTREKKIKAIVKEMDARRRDFIKGIIEGKIEALKENEEIIKELWSALLVMEGYMSMSSIKRIFTGKTEFDCTPEEKEYATKRVSECEAIHQMFAFMDYTMTNCGDLYDYNGRFNKVNADKRLKGYAILEKYGWSFEGEDEEKLLDGTHELYVK